MSYHKIKTVYARNARGELIMGEYSDPIFEFLADNEWVFTEKVDGTNIRVMYDGGKDMPEITLGGKTDNAQIPAGLIDWFQRTFPHDRKAEFKALSGESRVCLYGEGYGAKIQKGGGNYKADGQDFVLFDVRVGNWWLERDNVEDIARNLGLRCVPVIGRGTLADMTRAACRGFNSTWGHFPAEGIVARPKVGLLSRGGWRIITKSKTKDFARVAGPF